MEENLFPTVVRRRESISGYRLVQHLGWDRNNAPPRPGTQLNTSTTLVFLEPEDWGRCHREFMRASFGGGFTPGNSRLNASAWRQ